MTGTMSASIGGHRLQQLHEIGKLFTLFDVVDRTLDGAFKIVADKLPLESAIFIEAVSGERIDMVVWPSRGGDRQRLGLAKLHATAAYRYLTGTPMPTVLEVWEDLGPTPLPRTDREAAGGPHYIVIPLVVGRGKVFGALQLESASFERGDLELINAIANQLAIVLDRNRAHVHDLMRRREAQRLHVRYENLVGHLDGAFVWEADVETCRLTQVSSHIEHMLGFPREQYVDEPDWWGAHSHPDDRERLQHTFARALIEPGNKRCEHRCIARDGGVRWLRTSIHLVGFAGEPPRLHGVSFDVTAVRAAHDELRNQVALCKAITSILAEGTLAIDLEGRVTLINDAASALLGCSAATVLGCHAADLFHVETAERVAVESPLRAALRVGLVRSSAHTMVSSDRRRFSVRYTATAIRREGRVIGAVLVFDDTSDEVRGQI